MLTPERDQVLKAEVTDSIARFIQAFNAGIVEDIVALYTDSCILLPPSGPVVYGKQQLRDFWNYAIHELKMGEVSYNVEHLEVLSENFVSESTSFSAMVAGIHQLGKYLVIWQKVDNQWRMHQDIFNLTPI